MVIEISKILVVSVAFPIIWLSSLERELGYIEDRLELQGRQEIS